MVRDDLGTKTFQFRYWKKNGIQYRNWNGDELGTNIYKYFISIMILVSWCSFRELADFMDYVHKMFIFIKTRRDAGTTLIREVCIYGNGVCHGKFYLYIILCL